MFFARIKRDKSKLSITAHTFGESEIEAGLFGEEVQRGVWNHEGAEGGASGGGWGGPIPARPWMAISVKGNHAKYFEMVRSRVYALMVGAISRDDVVAEVGEVMVEDMKAQMADMGPPNAELTVEKKGHGDVLHDTGAMSAAHMWRRTK